MTVAPWVLSVLLFAALLLLVVQVNLGSRNGLESRVRSRVLVTLKSGATFDGVLFSADRSVWVLRNAQALGVGENGTAVPVDGEVLILAGDVEYAQKP